MIYTAFLLRFYMKRFREIHDIDTSVILEPKRTEDGYHCYRYRNLVGYKFFGKISLVALGELYKFVLNLETYYQQLDAFDFMFPFVMKKDVEIAVIRSEIDRISQKIEELDGRINIADRLILATTIADNCKILVTLDRNLIHNFAIEKEFRIEIKHPKELL